MRRRLRCTRREDGTSSLELVLYTPVLFFAIFATVQLSLFYLGNQAAAATARETARVARSGGGTPQAIADAVARGDLYARTVGEGVITCSGINVEHIGVDQIKVTVRCTGLQIVPGLGLPAITAVAQGPIEGFRGDPL
jgi:hypothetical protein